MRIKGRIKQFIFDMFREQILKSTKCVVNIKCENPILIESVNDVKPFRLTWTAAPFFDMRAAAEIAKDKHFDLFQTADTRCLLRDCIYTRVKGREIETIMYIGIRNNSKV